jgi:hypothetical protein
VKFSSHYISLHLEMQYGWLCTTSSFIFSLLFSMFIFRCYTNRILHKGSRKFTNSKEHETYIVKKLSKQKAESPHSVKGKFSEISNDFEVLRIFIKIPMEERMNELLFVSEDYVTLIRQPFPRFLHAN